MATTIIELLIVMIAHAAVGMYSSPLKYSGKLTYYIWIIWIVFQVGIITYAEYVLMDEAYNLVFGFILSFLGQYIIFFLTTKGKMAQRVFNILTYSIFFCIFMTLFNMIKGTVQSQNIVLLTFLNIVVFWGGVYYFLRYVCSVYRNVARNITTGWELLIFVNVFFLLAVILSSIFPVRITSFGNPMSITFIFLSVTIVVVYPIMFSKLNSMSEVAINREVEMENKLLLSQIEMEKKQYTSDRRYRHDRRHHNLVLLEFANNGDIDSIKEYLKNLVKKF